MVPLVKKISLKISDKKFSMISKSLGLLFVIDIITYMIIK